MSNFGFRINKYLKVSLILGVIDLLVFLIIGKVFNYLEVFNTLINNIKYMWFYISCIVIIVYIVDVLVFYDRNKKYKLLFIFKEPFINWDKYIYKNIKIPNAHKKCDFYKDIYYKVKNNDKIKGIMSDEILIRDLLVHMLLTNTIIVFIYFYIQNYNKTVMIFCFISLLIFYIILNFLYRNYLKYFITEIYIDFLNEKKTSLKN